MGSTRSAMVLVGIVLGGALGCGSSSAPPAPRGTGGTAPDTGGTTPDAGGSGGTSPPTGGSSGQTVPASGGSGPAADAALPPPSPDGGATGDATPTSGDEPGGPPPAGCVLKWSPNPMVDGEKAFEFLERPDRNMSHPNAVHFSVVPEHNAYRYDSHYNPPDAVDWDRAVFTGPMKTDRIRGEVRGMIGPDGQLDLVDGQTWRISWSLFVARSLKGTARFTHIFQLKFVDKAGGVSGSPIITLSLKSGDGIYLHIWLGGADFPTINLAGLHDRWLWTAVQFQLKPSGATVHWTLKDGDKVLIDKDQGGIVTWPSDAMRARPKWGIYRGITDDLQTSYMMASDYKAYLCQ